MALDLDLKWDELLIEDARHLRPVLILMLYSAGAGNLL